METQVNGERTLTKTLQFMITYQLVKLLYFLKKKNVVSWV